MIDFLLKNKEIQSFQSVEEINIEKLDFLIVQFNNYMQAGMDWAKKKL